MHVLSHESLEATLNAPVIRRSQIVTLPFSFRRRAAVLDPLQTFGLRVEQRGCVSGGSSLA
jgi:hypothetical protein